MNLVLLMSARHSVPWLAPADGVQSFYVGVKKSHIMGTTHYLTIGKDPGPQL